MADTLFDRLGGREGITRLVHQVMVNHFANPVVKARFEQAKRSREEIEAGAVEFFCSGLTGVPTYQGGPLDEVHAGMRVTDSEFNAVLDDILAAMESQGAGELEQAEVLKILYGMKGDVVGL